MSHKLKISLIKKGILENKCSVCNLNSWMDKEISCELHHLDGNNKNNKMENLQMLCPNCHSQTYNFRGRNKKRSGKKPISDEDLIKCIIESYTRREALLRAGLAGFGGNYPRINRLIEEGNKLKECPKSDEQIKRINTINEKYGSVKNSFRSVIEWPPIEELIELIKKESLLNISKKLGVSDNAIRAHCKRRGINIKDISAFSQKYSRKVVPRPEVESGNLSF